MLRMLALVALVGCHGDKPAPAPHTDEAFRADVRAYAIHTHRDLTAWGTLLLDGKTPHRFAELDMPLDDLGNPVPGSPEWSAYIVEDAPHFYLVRYWWNSPGFRASTFTGSEPTWTALPDTSIEHTQLFEHRQAHASIALRDGKLVLLRDEGANLHISDPADSIDAL